MHPDGKPHGVGERTTVFGGVYTGSFDNGKPSGYGVERGPDASFSYSGQFDSGRPSGFGVHVTAFGDQYMGEWLDGVRHGHGVNMDGDGAILIGSFAEDEPSELDQFDHSSARSVLANAAMAEMEAIRAQEAGREAALAAALQEVTTQGSSGVSSIDDADAAELAVQSELAAFVTATQADIAALETDTSAVRLEEAALLSRGKQLRALIQTRGRELERVAEFVAISAARRSQVADARRTLVALTREADALSANHVG